MLQTYCPSTARESSELFRRSLRKASYLCFQLFYFDGDFSSLATAVSLLRSAAST